MAIFDVTEEGLIQGGVMTTLDQPVTIQSGQQYGQVNLTFNPGIGVVVKCVVIDHCTGAYYTKATNHFYAL
jgi:hypothetical protein